MHKGFLHANFLLQNLVASEWRAHQPHSKVRRQQLFGETWTFLGQNELATPLAIWPALQLKNKDRFFFKIKIQLKEGKFHHKVLAFISAVREID